MSVSGLARLDPREKRGKFIVVTTDSYYVLVCDKKPSGLVTYSGGSSSLPETPGFVSEWRGSSAGQVVIRVGAPLDFVAQKQQDGWHYGASSVLGIFRADELSDGEVKAAVAEIQQPAS